MKIYDPDGKDISDCVTSFTLLVEPRELAKVLIEVKANVDINAVCVNDITEIVDDFLKKTAEAN